MIQWQESPTGFEAPRYAIVLEAPHRWHLLVKGRRRSEHGSASAAKAEAESLDAARLRNSKLLRIGVAFGAVVVLLTLAALFRFETNPARDRAIALTDEMESAFAAIHLGGAEPVDYVGDALSASSLTLPTGVEVAVLVGEAGGECYVSYWQDVGFRRARVLADNYPCAPGAWIASPNEHSYTRRVPLESWHIPAVQGDFDWEGLLPSATRQRGWFIPAVLGLSIAAFSLLTRAATTLLSGGSRRRSRSRR